VRSSTCALVEGDRRPADHQVPAQLRPQAAQQHAEVGVRLRRGEIIPQQVSQHVAGVRAARAGQVDQQRLGLAPGQPGGRHAVECDRQPTQGRDP